MTPKDKLKAAQRELHKCDLKTRVGRHDYDKWWSMVLAWQMILKRETT